MESLERSSAVIDLGKRLVAELKLGDDVTAQWMAHVLAERIHDAENASTEGKAAAQASCAELVFQLWERRYSLPSRIRPLKKLEPLLRTLDSLDASNGPRFRFMQEPPADVKVEEGVKEMLDAALAVDGAARILVQYYLASAAEQASEEAKPWIQGAVDAGADMTLEVRVVRFVDRGLDRSSDEASVAREVLKKKIRMLETFSSLAASHAADLRAKHGLLTDEADDAESDDE
jgi:hypothetical protein